MHNDSRYHFFFFNDTATTEIYTLSLHDALPISRAAHEVEHRKGRGCGEGARQRRDADSPAAAVQGNPRSEEHTSELQSRQYLVCRLLLEKKKENTSSFAFLFPYLLNTSLIWLAH